MGLQPITITLDGREVSGYPGMTILELAKESGVEIPTLCHDDRLPATGASVWWRTNKTGRCWRLVLRR
jgi:predicted molibdopterin-dependent oxidoreductase YjgC